LPSPAEISVKYGVEILRRILVARISGDKPRRNIERATQRDCEMGEIAAHAGAIGKHVARGGGWRRGSNPIRDIRAYPAADRLHLGIPRRNIAELVAREREQRFCIAIAAGK